MSQEAFDATPHAASLALYLCSQDADYRRPELRFGKQTDQLIVRKDPLIIEVGAQIGETLRKTSEESQGEIGGSASPRYHVRRAHWHHYWIGQKPNQELILKWLAPIYVNACRQPCKSA